MGTYWYFRFFKPVTYAVGGTVLAVYLPKHKVLDDLAWLLCIRWVLDLIYGKDERTQLWNNYNNDGY